ncbi:uncharacterized protein LAJ45_03460 [Morchella importuna]|uniref:uncharacterized protein n=1 Tax=Morchella importuna TaxID=1174673 RepID=UPI001E8DD943|nr:uncharacterized protein LAJ45_03460 [Morchella importuna]KAH8152619.1 hypothetical protein LAJ45_03460 [Morchella importuna]
MSKSDLSSIKLSYATPSLGMHPTHTLPLKLSAISTAGYQGFELGFDDLLSFARQYLRISDLAEDDYDNLCTAAGEVGRLCDELELEVLVFQPFSNFEGYAEGTEKRKKAFDKARGWMRIMDAVGCEMLQVGSNDDPSSISSFPEIARDLAALADLYHPRRIAYENWAWGAHVNTWTHINEVIKLADRPNLGLCLDTFQTASLEWGDPCVPSGKIENADEIYKASLKKLEKEVDPEKIFFFQISDAYHIVPPLEREGETPPRGRWSHASRPLPYHGGYLPVLDMVKAVLRTGFRGWFSVEVFLEEEHSKELKDGLLDDWAKEGMKSVKRLLEDAEKGI